MDAGALKKDLAFKLVANWEHGCWHLNIVLLENYNSRLDLS